MNKNIIVSVIFFFSSLSLTEVINAPFGFEWGQTQFILKAKGITLENCKVSDLSIEYCKAFNSPKKFSKADYFFLYFPPGEGLQKVMMLGKDIEGDPYGTDGKKQYFSLKESLIKKYDKPSNTFEWIGSELYKDADEFYECLNYGSCGNQSSFWLEDISGTISLELKGVSRGSGYIKLTYESKDWSNILDRLENEKNLIDEDSL